MRFVKKVRHIEAYKLGITFNDGVVKQVDLSPYLQGKVFRPLRNLGLFKRVKVNPDIDTICWTNGADLSPEFLYQIGRPLKS